MEDTLFQSNVLSAEERIRLPNETFFIPNSFKESSDTQQVWQKVTGAKSVVVADNDLDGLSSAAAHFVAEPESVYVSSGPHGGRVSLPTAFEAIAQNAADDVTVTIADIGVDSFDDVRGLETLTENASTVRWFDHHQWHNDEVTAHIEEQTDVLIVDDSQDTHDDDGSIIEKNARCAAQIVRDYFAEEEGVEYSRQFTDGLNAVAAYDLWRKDENGEFIWDMSAPLNDFATSVSWAATSPYSDGGFMDYITLYVDHGFDLLSLPSVERRIEAHQNQVSEQYQAAFDNFDEIATTETLTLAGQSVKTAVIFGNFPQNKVSDTLQREEGYDLVVTLTPTGGVSIRSTNQFPKSHFIAFQIDGGGHPQAAGGYIGDQFNTILDYIDYWGSNGETQRDAFITLLQEMTADEFTRND